MTILQECFTFDFVDKLSYCDSIISLFSLSNKLISLTVEMEMKLP